MIIESWPSSSMFSIDISFSRRDVLSMSSSSDMGLSEWQSALCWDSEASNESQFVLSNVARSVVRVDAVSVISPSVELNGLCPLAAQLSATELLPSSTDIPQSMFWGRCFKVAVIKSGSAQIWWQELSSDKLPAMECFGSGRRAGCISTNCRTYTSVVSASNRTARSQSDTADRRQPTIAAKTAVRQHKDVTDISIFGKYWRQNRTAAHFTSQSTSCTTAPNIVTRQAGCTVSVQCDLETKWTAARRTNSDGSAWHKQRTFFTISSYTVHIHALNCGYMWNKIILK